MLLYSLIAIFFSCSAAFAAGLDPATINSVRSKMQDIVEQSWEFGTAAEALLELDEPEVSVFGHNPFSPSGNLSTSSWVINLAQQVLANRTLGQGPLILDAAVGDSASVGVAVLVANRTLSDNSYAEAAKEQLDYLLYTAPHGQNGEISHRDEQVQLWADFVYMAPPFIAYYGALTNDIGLLQEAHKQVKLYRDALQGPGTELWRHVAWGDWEDPSYWGTGNAWAAAGAVRVSRTLRMSGLATQLESEIGDLNAWAGEIVAAAWASRTNGCLYNKAGLVDYDFPDCSWTALIAAVTYRLAVETGDDSMIPQADMAFDYIATRQISGGTLQNVVDPLGWTYLADQSPEGQAFVLLLQAAWRDHNTTRVSGLSPTLHPRMNRGRHRRS